MIVDSLRTTLHRALATRRGDQFAPFRAAKDVVRGINHLIGEPICSAEEMTRRRNAQARLQVLRAQGSAPVREQREPSPVMVYLEKDRHQRSIDRVDQILKARGIAYTRLDVTGDPNTKSFVMRAAKCEEDDLPIVFVGGEPIGGFRELVAADASGALVKAVFGENAARR